ncbi:MAG: hypothetical protein HYX65_05575 [Gemmatimonadetes bacterium]|nr:hypothetical protein [Gemmatimonadota bacterium]
MSRPPRVPPAAIARGLARLALAAMLAATSAAAQQNAPEPPAATPTPGQVRAFHDRAAQIIAGASRGSLPAGDTLVTWHNQPILWHTAAVFADSVKNGLVRRDSMVGVAEIHWRNSAPVRFRARWTEPGKRAVVRRGTVARGRIVVTGSRDTTLVVPASAWGAADVGMDDQLLPLLVTMPPSAEPLRLIVLRPYTLSWDTLAVTSARRGEVQVISVRSGSQPNRLFVIFEGKLIWLRDVAQQNERRPLESTAAYRVFVRARQAMGQQP